MSKMQNPGELAGTTKADPEGCDFKGGRSRGGAYAAAALCDALAECDPKAASEICAAYLDARRTGGPVLGDPFGMVSGDAGLWADSAPVHELAAYGVAALDRLRTANLGLNARKRLFAAIWQSFPEQDRKAFLARVDAEGRFVYRGAE